MNGIFVNSENLTSYKKNKNYDYGILFLLPINTYNQFISLDKKSEKDRIDFLNSEKFNKNIIKEYIIYFNTKQKIIEVRDIIKNPQHISEIINTLNKSFPEDFVIWVGRLDENSAATFIDLGFNNPYICNKSPLKFSFKKKSIALLKNNRISNNKKNINYAKNKLLYTSLSQNKKFCCIYAKFSDEAIKYLKNINDPKKPHQKEMSGSFKISKVIKSNEDKIIFEISQNESSTISGLEEEVDAVWSRYNFHTHPKIAYDNTKVKKGWPSSDDYLAFIMLRQHTIFHTVVTLEGLYIISYTPYWVNKINPDTIDEEYILKHYNISHKKNISFQEYVNKINKIKYKKYKHPIFVVKFLEWNNATEIFSVFFQKTNGGCLLNDKQFYLYDKQQKEKKEFQ